MRKPINELAGYGYRTVKAPNHPLVGKSGFLHEHRIALWDKIGPGPHRCHHCRGRVDWFPGDGTHRNKLVADHLNGNPRDNAPQNLVPSCHACNLKNCDPRVPRDDLFVVDHLGTRHRISQGECITCGLTFLRFDAGKKAPSEYCSCSCARGRKPTA